MRKKRFSEIYQKRMSGPLTRQERRVLHLLCQGYSNEGIVKTLKIARGTLASHIVFLYKKLGIHDRSGLIKLALAKGTYTYHPDISIYQ